MKWRVFFPDKFYDVEAETEEKACNLATTLLVEELSKEPRAAFLTAWEQPDRDNESL